VAGLTAGLVQKAAPKKMTMIEERDEVLPATAEPLYLKPAIKLEPLVGRWHAFQHMVAPVQAALNFASRQIPLLESFIRSPSVHISASKDPALYGGAFVELRERDLQAAKDLLADTRVRAAALLRLAADVRKLNADLRAGATGSSLDARYSQLPASLAGAVELLYDTNNQARFRVLDHLLHEAAEALEDLQEVMLSPAGDRGRQFFLNTPRLQSDGGELYLRKPFKDPVIDILARSRLQAIDVEDFARDLDLGPADRRRLGALFHDQAPERREPDYAGDQVRVRSFGHAAMLLQTRNVSILIDPTFAFERDDALASLTFMDLPDRIDYVVISHAHQDHFCLESLLQLRGRVGCVLVPRNNGCSTADPALKATLLRLGFPNVIAMDEFDTVDVPDGRITSLPFPGEHSQLDIQSKQCIAIELKNKTALFLVDADAVDPRLFQRMTLDFPKVDALFIGMECEGAPMSWLYGPLLLKAVTRGDDQSRRGNGSNCERAWAVVEAMRPRNVYIYAMGLEPWNRHLLGLEYTPQSVQITESDAFVARCRAAGLPAQRLKGCQEVSF
jgi:L-ascorbate metabolism protein UlaG (beta-lactamase superfamily)